MGFSEYGMCHRGNWKRDDDFDVADKESLLYAVNGVSE